MRVRLRRLGLGLATLVGPKPGGFFIPYRYAGSATPRDYPALAPLFEAAEPRLRSVLDAVDGYAGDLLRIGTGTGPPGSTRTGSRPSTRPSPTPWCAGSGRPHRGDRVRPFHALPGPRRRRRDLGAVLTCIDPSPRASLARLPSATRRGFSTTRTGLVAALAPGDILFIDSSHVAMPGTDVDRLFLDFLPRLRAGTLVHVHDIFLPGAYPPAWTWRGYNEQLLAGALLAGGGYEIVFASAYAVAASLASTGVVRELRAGRDAPDSSLWLRKL
jgi:hypothetical protein